MTRDEELRVLLEQLKANCVSASGVVEDYMDGAVVISARFIYENIDRIIKCLDAPSIPIKKFLFVEDGTVDTETLEIILGSRSPETQLVVYRQGGRKPELVEVNK